MKADYLNKAHLVAHTTALFHPREQRKLIRRQREDKERHGRVAFKSVVVDKMSTTPFSHLLSAEMGQRAVAGEQVYSIMDMRRELWTLRYLNYVVDDVDGGSPRAEAADHDFPLL